MRKELDVYEKLHSKKAFRGETKYYETIAERTLGKATLDVGCGEGWLESFNPQIVGVDFSLFALNKAKRNCVGPNLVRADAHNLPFRDEFFEQVVSLGCLEHFENKKKAVEELSRVLMKNGELILVVDVDRPILRLYNLTIRVAKNVLRVPSQPEQNPSKSNVIHMLKSRGFSILESRDIKARSRLASLVPGFFVNAIKTNIEKSRSGIQCEPQ